MEEELFKYLAQHIHLTEEDKDMFASMDLFRSYKKGHIILREGAVAKCSYFVIKGCLSSFYIKNGEEKTTGFYLEEEGISPEGLTTQTPSKYTIRCEEDSILLVASPDMEQSVFQKYPKFESLCRILSEKEVIKMQKRYDDYVTSNPEERYLKLMRDQPELLQRVPQYQIASYLGIKPESLSRIRKRLFN